MKARLRAHLPLRFHKAVSLARRELYCERLESRCLMHGMPLAADYPPDEGLAWPDGQEQPVAALVQQPSLQDADTSQNEVSPAVDDYSQDAALTNVSSVEAVGTAQDASTREDSNPLEDAGDDASELTEGDDEKSSDNSPSEGTESSQEPEPVEPIDQGGLPEPEGEAVPFSPTGSAGALSGRSSSVGVSDAFAPARASAPLGDAGTSALASRVAAALDAQSSLDALADYHSQDTSSSAAVTNTLGHANGDAVNQGLTSAYADSSTGNANSLGMSLNSDVQSQSNLSESGLSDVGLSPELPSVDGSVAPSPWLFSSAEPASNAVYAPWSFPTGQHLVEAMRSVDSDDNSTVQATRLASESTDGKITGEATESEDTPNELYALRVVEQLSRQRKAERAASSSPTMQEPSIRDAKASTLHAYLRVRASREGLVELAVEPTATLDDSSKAYAVRPASAASMHNLSGASLELYREFDLATVADQPNANFSDSVTLPVGLGEISSDAMDELEAVDAAHADGESDGSVISNLGEATLPLGLLALSSFLAISRHRFHRPLPLRQP